MSYKNNKIKKWSNDDVLAWVKSIGLSSKWEEIMITSVTESECTGQDMNTLKSGKEIGESFGIKQPMLYNRIFREFKKIKKDQEAAAAQVAMENMNLVVVQQNNDNYVKEQKEKDGFELNLFAQSKYWDIRQKVTANTKVRRVKELYKNESGVGTAVDDIVLYSSGKELADPNKTLGYYDITDDRNLITVKFKTVGGAQYVSDSDSDNERERVINFKKYGIKKSNKADCLIGYDDDDDIDRADVGCPYKHAMAASTMFNYIKQVLQKNIKAVTVPCPMCKHILDWEKCTQIADMTGKEYAQWTRVIEKRLEGETKTCPHCKAGCQRKKGVIIFRMRCTACSGSDWCWNCLKPWKGGGLIYCSNDDCQLIKDVNKVLRDAPLITPGYLKDVKIPKTRACPMCLTFIEHKEACKHMKCVGCTGDFCFVCLGTKDKEKGTWPCNDHTYECEPHKVQEFK